MQSVVGGGGELSISIINALNNIICFSAAAEEEEREREEEVRLNAHNEGVSATD